MPSQLLVIRHGQTEWSQAGKHTGRSDIPLTATGRDEAAATARTLHSWHVDRVYTSPLSRAKQTAQIVDLDAPATTDPLLVEWDYGAYEARRTVDIREEIPSWSVWHRPLVRPRPDRRSPIRSGDRDHQPARLAPRGPGRSGAEPAVR